MDWIYWVAGGGIVAVVMIVIAIVRSGDGGNAPLDPYDGDGW